MRRWELRYLIAVVGALAFLALGPRLLIDALTSATERPDGPVAQVSTLRFTPVADTYVNEAHPHTSYGDRLDFDVDGKPVKEAYLMFNLSGIDGLVTSAKLRLLVTNASPHSGGSIRQVSDTTWSETEMTFKKRPMIDGPVLSTLGPVEKGQVVTFDVTRADLRNGLVSFAMTSHRQDGVEYASRESPNSPELVITVTTGGSGVTTVRSTSPPGDPVLVGAGDIASCRSNGARETARLIASIPGTVFTAGDHAYPDGTARQFAECYGPTWGLFKERTRPAPGNHDYRTEGARPYFEYFGENAGPPGRGYYSYSLGTWRILVIDSNIAVDKESPQYAWLQQELTANPVICTLAIWHHPRFSSAKHGSQKKMASIWELLYAHHVDVVINGHDHVYERLEPMDADGNRDDEHGIRTFVVGTGGVGLYKFGTPLATSEVRDNDTLGVLKLTLHDGSYDWEFIPVPGGSFTDSGTGTCH